MPPENNNEDVVKPNYKKIFIIILFVGALIGAYFFINNNQKESMNESNNTEENNMNNNQSGEINNNVSKEEINGAIANYETLVGLLEKGDFQGAKDFTKGGANENHSDFLNINTPEDAKQIFDNVLSNVREANLRADGVEWSIQKKDGGEPILYATNFPVGDNIADTSTDKSSNWMAFELINGSWYWVTLNYSPDSVKNIEDSTKEYFMVTINGKNVQIEIKVNGKVAYSNNDGGMFAEFVELNPFLIKGENKIEVTAKKIPTDYGNTYANFAFGHSEPGSEDLIYDQENDLEIDLENTLKEKGEASFSHVIKTTENFISK